MNKFSLVVMFSIGLNFGVQAENLPFPRSEAEIIQALPAPQVDSLCPPMIPKCELKVMEEKGLAEIVDDYPDLPKVGALIQFDYGSANIRQDSYELLGLYGRALMGGLNDAVIMVVGHTDYMGTEVYNQWLSERRAEAVKNFLVSIYKIEPTHFRTVGFGESQPLRGNRHFQSDTEREWNRRVEFVRLK